MEGVVGEEVVDEEEVQKEEEDVEKGLQVEMEMQKREAVEEEMQVEEGSLSSQEWLYGCGSKGPGQSQCLSPGCLSVSRAVRGTRLGRRQRSLHSKVKMEIKMSLR
ncbi:unnamed protein product [Lota lota]